MILGTVSFVTRSRKKLESFYQNRHSELEEGLTYHSTKAQKAHAKFAIRNSGYKIRDTKFGIRNSGYEIRDELGQSSVRARITKTKDGGCCG